MEASNVAAANPIGSVRHAEKRRISTCRFADRIAQFCVDHYRKHVPSSFRETQKQTCLAAIVAFVNKHDGNNNKMPLATPLESVNIGDGEAGGSCFYMLGMGVGTKFLSGDLLEEEVKIDPANTGSSSSYGRRVRDCHAEVLARRAFRREILLCILQDLNSNNARISPPILCRKTLSDGKFCYGLRPGVTLHMYTSSAPCGNATLKKFATMKKERFRDDLNDTEWPGGAHEPIEGHSIPLGQFALLVKKERNPSDQSQDPSPPSSTNGNNQQNNPPKNCPALQSTDWCPPGTTTVWSGQGTLHTCSDKICRWNCLGLQGSLLASLLQSPLYMSSLTVGRKLTETICRRAVCCRAAACKQKKKKRKKNDIGVGNDNDTASTVPVNTSSTGYHINHPAIMGTSVYMDDSGVIEMSSQSDNNGDRIEGQDVRFHSTLCWAWWPSIAADRESEYKGAKTKTDAECIDGVTGFAIPSISQESEPDDTPSPTKGGSSKVDDESFVSQISTKSLVDLHFQVKALLTPEDAQTGNRPQSLRELEELKRNSSPEYETQKHELLTSHPLFRQWKRREACIAEELTPTSYHN